MKKLLNSVNLNWNTELNYCYQQRVKIITEYYNDLPKDAKRIEGTLNWCAPDGTVYGQDTRLVPNKYYKDMFTKTKNYGKYFKLACRLRQGHVYCSLKELVIDGKYIRKDAMVSNIIAKAFLPNPDNLPIVGHKNEIKTDNRVDNLYWTDFSKCTNQKSDTQPKPVIMYDTKTNKELGRYRSVSDAARQTGISKTTIARQAKYHRPVRKPWYFRYQD